MTIQAYVEQQMREIIAWEHEEPWLVTKQFNKLTAPLAWGIRIIIPKVAVKGAVLMADWVGSLTTRETWTLKETGLDSIEKVRSLALEKQDGMANSVHNWAIGIAAAEGGAAGAAGLPGMAIDIPAVISLAFRTTHQIGLC